MRHTVRYKNILVEYEPELNGGGLGFGQEFVDIVRKKFGKVDHIFEYCAGPGFIGFSLLAHGLCNKLTLSDVNQKTVKLCEETIKKNSLQDTVSVYLSDCLDGIPKNEKWDLVVSNPPHLLSTKEKYHEDIKRYDPDFMVHKNFYRDIHTFLKPGGSILFQENGYFHKSEAFIPMIEENGLQLVEVFNAKLCSIFAYVKCILRKRNLKKCSRQSPIYYMWSKQKNKR